jgi:hypothetical protein
MAVAEQTVVSQNATVVLAETGNENKKEVHTDRGLDTLPSLVAGSPPPLNGKRALPSGDTLANGEPVATWSETERKLKTSHHMERQSERNDARIQGCCFNIKTLLIQLY